MNKLLTLILILVSVSFFSKDLYAQQVDYAKPAWYLSVAGTFDAHLFDSDLKNLTDGDVTLDNAWGMDFKFGRRFNKWFSLEAEYEFVNGFDLKFDDIKILSVQANTLTGNVKFHWPIQRFLPYVMIGMGGTWYNIKDEVGLGIGFDSDLALAGRAGGGIDIFITENWAINTSYTIVVTTFDLTNPTKPDNISDVHYGAFQIGVAYYF